jgi:hypothetical protein
MSQTPYTHNPDELFDLGEAGEHPITFSCWIYCEPDRKPQVRFMKAIVDVTYSGQRTQRLDVTPHILASPWTRERWEDEIIQAFENAREKTERDYDEGA